LQLGDALAAKGDLEGQETEYKAACNIDRDDPLLKTVRASRFISLAKLQLKRKEFPEALASAATAIQLNPDAPYAYLVRAQAMHLQGRDAQATTERNKAETYIKQAMAKDKKPPDLAVPLAIFIDDDAPELIRLLEPEEKTLSAFEKMLLATAYFAVGTPEIGEAEFNKSLEDPKMNTAEVHFTLAGLLRQAQWTEKAVKEYSTAYAMDPENVTYKYEYEALRRQDSR
jgi:tetratricopeptide (TPR) repeat protein